MPAKLGLRVKWCENVAKYRDTSSISVRIEEVVGDGWFIQVRYQKKWRSIMNLRFAREKDALRAAHALTAAGLDSYDALNKADGMTVKQVACEYLQW